MIIDINNIYELIDKYLRNGYLPGSLEDCFKNNNYFHLSFDDGFKEHLGVAYLLKKRYDFDKDSVSFAINVGNSINHNFTGMDIIYSILENNKTEKLNYFFKTEFNATNISEIKNYIARLSPEELIQLSNYFSELHKQLKDIFLDKFEIIELSKIFQIVSHGITHRFLTNHQKESKKEILQSKNILENIIDNKIEIFCYPEGKNDDEIQYYCKKAGYKMALSIRHEQENRFCIGRKIF